MHRGVDRCIMAGMRPLRFMVGSRDRVDARTLAERARWSEGIGCCHVAVTTISEV